MGFHIRFINGNILDGFLLMFFTQSVQHSFDAFVLAVFDWCIVHEQIVAYFVEAALTQPSFFQSFIVRSEHGHFLQSHFRVAFSAFETVNFDNNRQWRRIHGNIRSAYYPYTRFESRCVPDVPVVWKRASSKDA